MRGLDVSKDQSFFLSRVNQEALQCSMFPLGRYFVLITLSLVFHNLSFRPVVVVVLVNVYISPVFAALLLLVFFLCFSFFFSFFFLSFFLFLYCLFVVSLSLTSFFSFFPFFCFIHSFSHFFSSSFSYINHSPASKSPPSNPWPVLWASIV